MAETAKPKSRITEVSDNRLKALYGYETVSKFKENNEALKKAAKGDVDLAVSIGIGSSSSKSESHSKITEVKGSMIQSGENVRIRTEENINVKGSEISGNNVTLEAGKDIHISAAEETMTEKTSQKKRGGSIGVNLSAGSVVSVTGSLYTGKEKEKSSITSYKESTVTASNTLAMKSGKDTRLIGSTADGNKVEAEIGGNLAVESLQTKKEYSEETKSAGISFGRASGKTSYSGSVSKGSMKSDYESVTSQTGIRARDEGFNITVKDNTHLKGGVIDSKAEKEKNNLTTGTLSWEDVKNKAEYKGSGTGISFTTDKNARYNERGVTPAVSTGSKEKASSVTKSAVAKGTITITDKEKQKQDITSLNRDTKNSLNQLSEIFDKTKVEERQELAGLFGKIAYNAIHDMKDGAKKTAMHALTGGIMSKLSSGDFISGATSATVNKMLESEIRKVSKGDPATMQWMSAIVGGIASELVSGNGQIGASVAGSATKNNSLKDLIAAINGTFDADQANEDTKADDHQEPEGDIYESGAGEEESAMQGSESMVGDDILPEIPLSDKDANQAIRDVVLDKSAEIAATGTVSWMSSNWLEAQYGFSRSEADAIGRNIGNNASTVWGGISYLKSVVENHRRYHSWETAIKADAYDTLPISAGIVGAAVGGALGYAPGALGGALVASGAATIYVEQKKNEWQRDEQNEKRQGK